MEVQVEAAAASSSSSPSLPSNYVTIHDLKQRWLQKQQQTPSPIISVAPQPKPEPQSEPKPIKPQNDDVLGTKQVSPPKSFIKHEVIIKTGVKVLQDDDFGDLSRAKIVANSNIDDSNICVDGENDNTNGNDGDQSNVFKKKYRKKKKKKKSSKYIRQNSNEIGPKLEHEAKLEGESEVVEQVEVEKGQQRRRRDWGRKPRGFSDKNEVGVELKPEMGPKLGLEIGLGEEMEQEVEKGKPRERRDGGRDNKVNVNKNVVEFELKVETEMGMGMVMVEEKGKPRGWRNGGGRKPGVISDKNEVGAETGPKLEMGLKLGEEQVEEKGQVRQQRRDGGGRKPRVITNQNETELKLENVEEKGNSRQHRDGRRNPRPVVASGEKEKPVSVSENVNVGGGDDAVKVEAVKVSNVQGKDKSCDGGRSGDDVKERNVGQRRDGRRGGNGRFPGKPNLGGRRPSSSFGEKTGEFVWVKKGESLLVPN